jgi:putative transposase
MGGVTLDFSRPGKPTDNAFIESLSGKFQAECLSSIDWVLSRRWESTIAATE